MRRAIAAEYAFIGRLADRSGGSRPRISKIGGGLPARSSLVCLHHRPGPTTIEAPPTTSLQVAAVSLDEAKGRVRVFLGEPDALLEGGVDPDSSQPGAPATTGCCDIDRNWRAGPARFAVQHVEPAQP
jgi:hypothetical protein